jgi:DNA topoisomerase-1
LTLETINDIFKEKATEDEPLGDHPETNESVWIKKGPYGHYVQLGDTKTRKGIPKGYPVTEVKLDYALKLLALPRTVGQHPESGDPITADYGRYGPYLKCGKQNASLRGVETPLDVTLEKAVELLANRNKKSSELKSLGAHPESGKTIVVKDGRYGPYVTDGNINVSLKGDSTPDTVTLEQAVELINNKRLTSPRKKQKQKKKK